MTAVAPSSLALDTTHTMAVIFLSLKKTPNSRFSFIFVLCFCFPAQTNDTCMTDGHSEGRTYYLFRVHFLSPEWEV